MQRPRKNQRGVSIIAAIFIIVILAFMGVMLVSLVNTSNLTAVHDLHSAQAVNVAEGGLESALLSLTTPTLSERLACSGIANNANLTAETLGNGQFTVTTAAGSPFYPAAAATLNASINSTDATVNVSAAPAGYAASGRIMIDQELIDYTGISGSSFIGAVRGRDGTTAASHVSGARVGQNQCVVASSGGVPDLTTPSSQRTVSAAVQIQEGWIAGSGFVTNLRGIDCAASNDCWAVGDGGKILRYNGTTWSAVASPTTQNLRSVAVASSTAVWAVGDAGTIIKWDGTSWAVQPSPTSTQLNSVDMVSTSTGWAVGNGGVIIKTSNGGTTWSSQTSPTAYNLHAIFMFTSTTGWAMGAKNTGSNKPTIVYTTNASSWTDGTSSAPATNQAMNSLMLYDASSLLGLGLGGCNDYAVAVGDAGTAMDADGGTVLLGLIGLGGSGWVSIGSGQAQDLNGVTFFQKCCGLLCLGCCQDGWAVGNGGVIRQWNGSGWSAETSPTAQNLNAVWINTSNQNDGWAVGDAGTILRWNGTSWSTWSLTFAAMNRWNETSWSDAEALLPLNMKGLNSVSMLSYADGWAVGNAVSTTSDSGWTFLRWNNPVANTWSQAAVTTAANAANLMSLFMVSSQDGFAVGNTNADSGGSCTASRARILHWNGASWSCQTSPALAQLNSVFMLDTTNDGTANDGWAVGNRNGTGNTNWNLTRWNGTSWALTNSVSPATAAQNLNSVSMLSATDGWAVGAGGIILRWNSPSAANWNVATSPTANQLYSVSMLSATDGWAVGAGGTILRWNSPTAGSWNVIASPTANQLNSVFCANADDCWAAGSSGTTIHWDGTSWASVATGLLANTLQQVRVIGPKERPQSAWQEVVN